MGGGGPSGCGSCGWWEQDTLAAKLSYHRCMATLQSEEGWPTAARMLTHEEARAEQRLYWSQKSIPERLAAMTELNRRMYSMRGIDIDELKTDFTPSRVRRSRR